MDRLEGTKMLLLLLLALLLAALLAHADDPAKYTTKYDNVDIESVIQNDRLLSSYVGCLLGSKSCTPDAAELKANLPDALATNCSSCSEAQKKISDRLTHHLIDQRPQEWAQLESKYDPSGTYRELYLNSKDGAGAATSTANHKDD